MKNSYENMEDMQRMQQEAVRRVKEMQKRAKQSLVAGTRYSESNNLNAHVSNGSENKMSEPSIDENKESKKQSEENENKNIQHKKRLSHATNKFDFFSELLKDREKSLILLLILLLVDEGSDMSLVMALMYLII